MNIKVDIDRFDMSQEEETKPADSNKEAAEVDCKLKVSKCVHSGAKTAEEVEAIIRCLNESAQP